MRVITDYPREVRVIENEWITMSDGCRLAARLWLPSDATQHPVPAVLECMPYRKRDFTRLRDEALHSYFAGHGYASLRLDLRGTGDSEGLILDEYLRQEQDDIIEVIDWVTAQPWCSGDVGMIGISWGGFNALQVAARRPPALKTIISMCSTDDRYADDAHYKGGCLLNENLTWGSVFLASVTCPPDPVLLGDAWRDVWRQRIENAVLYPAEWMAHQQRDDYWKHGSVCEDFAAIECSVYAVGGWADGYSNAIPRLLEGLSSPRKGLIGPWSHAFPHNALPGPSIGFFQEALRWWDYWLKGIDTGVMDEPMLRVWMEEYVDPAPTYELRPGRWVAETSWPSPNLVARRWHLNVLTLGDRAEPEDRMRVSSPQTTGQAGGDWYGFGAEGESPIDQREDDGRSLVFDSDPFTERLEFLGTPRVHLELSVDRPVAYVIVRLNDVAPDGASSRVSYGVVNLTQRHSREHPQAVPVGERFGVDVALNDVAYAFAPGHTMRVAISTCYWPVLWPAPEPVGLTLHTGASHLELPRREPQPEDDALKPFEPPERGARSSHTALRSSPLERTVLRDLTTNETTYTVFSDGGDFGGASLARLDAIDLVVGYTIRETYRIHEYDPRGARMTVEQQAVHRRGEWSTRLDCRTTLTATAEEFRLYATLEAFEGGEPFARREWDERIPRKLV